MVCYTFLHTCRFEDKFIVRIVAFSFFKVSSHKYLHLNKISQFVWFSWFILSSPVLLFFLLKPSCFWTVNEYVFSHRVNLFVWQNRNAFSFHFFLDLCNRCNIVVENISHNSLLSASPRFVNSLLSRGWLFKTLLILFFSPSS